MHRALKVSIAIFGVAMSVLVVKNAVDLHYLRGAIHNLIQYLEQGEYDEAFVDIVKRELGDLDDEIE